MKLKINLKRLLNLSKTKLLLLLKKVKKTVNYTGLLNPKEITNLIKEKAKADVSPSQIILKDELNKVGLFKVEINFHSEVKTNISIKIDKIKSK